QYVDTLIIIPNQNLFRIANEKTTFADAFKMADDVLHSGVRGVTDLMVMPGLINLDFADIRSVMTEMGKAMMGTGEASGERRSIQASEAAISNPLLDDVSMKGARGVLINITGGYDMTLFEVDEAANRIRDEVDPDANIIFGSTFDPSMDGVMRVSVVATGIDAASMAISAARSHSAGAAMVQAAAALPTAAASNPAPAFGLPGAKRSLSGNTSNSVPSGAGIASGRAVDYHSTLVAAPMAPTSMHGQSGTNTATARALEPEEMVAAKESVHNSPQAAANAAAAVRAALGAEPIPTRQSGPLRGERRDGVFIPPRPVDPGPRQVAASHDASSEDRSRKRSMSLFERVTGLGWRSQEESEEREVPPTRAAPVASVASPPARLQQPAQPAGKGPSGSRQPEGDRVKLSRVEEDVLDIPAFLRRQAN
ncbi:MAG: cell division protein FtsZ, partial [Rhodospirillaceae bacterium]